MIEILKEYPAHEVIEPIVKKISFCLNEDKSIYKDAFEYIILKKIWLEEKSLVMNLSYWDS